MIKQSAKGFTLIELMIVIAVLAILAVIAYPSYDTFIRRARMEEAKASIMETVRDMEHYYARHRSFVGAPAPANTDYFDITFAANSPGADRYEIEAKPKAGYAARETSTLYYNSIGILSKCDAALDNCTQY